MDRNEPQRLPVVADTTTQHILRRSVEHALSAAAAKSQELATLIDALRHEHPDLTVSLAFAPQQGSAGAVHISVSDKTLYVYDSTLSLWLGIKRSLSGSQNITPNASGTVALFMVPGDTYVMSASIAMIGSGAFTGTLDIIRQDTLTTISTTALAAGAGQTIQTVNILTQFTTDTVLRFKVTTTSGVAPEFAIDVTACAVGA